VSGLAWERRPLEERANYNPAFMACLLRQAAEGYREQTQRPLPTPLAFLVIPLVLHRPTRIALPRIVSTSMPIWLQEHQFLREGFAGRTRALAPSVREAVLIALQTGVLRLAESALEAATEPGQPRRATSETRDISARAHFVGRWLGRAGDIETIYFLWGVKP
jgi:hypothetical protein